jgi:formate--tetrahydrofolate ligase
LKPEAVVLVTTIKALRHHGGAKKADLQTANLERVLAGLPNLGKHVENIFKFGIRPIVCINHFPTDADDEIEAVQQYCHGLGVQAMVSKAFAEGGKGSAALAEAVVASIASKENQFKPLYQWHWPIEQKIETIAREIYGADGVAYSVKAKANLKLIKELGMEALPVCMAKTPKSLSDDEKKLGRPSGFVVTIREFEFASGAGFVIPVLGDMMRMPGLPATPAAEQIDLSDNGKITGLF